MSRDASPIRLIAQEARALLDRLSRIKSFALQETMVPAAALSPEAQSAVEWHLARTVHRLKHRGSDFVRWINSEEAAAMDPAECQKRFTLLRLRFNSVLCHVDIFSEAISQRSEAETGVWLSGLDVVCRDALSLPGYIEPPPIVCYLARGPGAAIRRARTRLPGGGQNPIAIIRVPRERMISSSLASSLIHEVGHQGAALLGLVPSLRQAIRERVPRGVDSRTWELFGRWISEIVADFWSISKVGVTSTAGLLGVVSLPWPFVFRFNPDDPHPVPYLRVKLSAAIGDALYPHSQWRRLSQIWTSLYPTSVLTPERQQFMKDVESCFPALIDLLVNHRPKALGGAMLAESLASPERTPERLAKLHERLGKCVSRLGRLPPSLAFAVVGQARGDGVITPEQEGDMLAALLRLWAWRSTVDASEACAANRRHGIGKSPKTGRFTAETVR